MARLETPDESETILLRDGDLVLATAGTMPRTPTPFAGWTFERGPRRRTERMEEDYSLDTYDVRVTHADVVEELTANDRRFTAAAGPALG